MDNKSDMSPKKAKKSKRNAIRKTLSSNDDCLSKNENLSLDVLTSGSQSVNLDFLLLYSKQSNQSIDEEAKGKCKILKFSTEWTYEEILMEIVKLDPKLYHNLFIFIFEIENISIKTSKDEKSLKILRKFVTKFGNKNRPLIMQVTSIPEGATKIFYKEEKSKNVSEAKQKFNNSESFGDFQSFFLFYMNTKCDEFENLFIQKFNFCDKHSLTLRFLRVLVLSEDFFTNLILTCGSYGSKNDTIAVLDVPFGCEAESLVNTCLSEEYEFSDGYKSVLSNAVEQSNMKVFEFLVQNGQHLIKNLSLMHQYEISTAAFTANQISLLCDLIELCDFPFPQDFNPETVEDERLRRIIKTRSELHKAIKQDDQTKIMEFIKSYPKLQVAFNTNNNSSLSRALHFKKFDIFYLMRSYGFYALEFDDHKEYVKDKEDLKDMKSAAAAQRRKNVDNSLASDHNSVNSLSMKSYIYNKSISRTTKNTYHDTIRRWYKDIYIAELNQLLMDVAASCPELRLIFDFDSETTEKIDLCDMKTDGTMFSVTKWIMIGAKQFINNKNREHRIKGTIIHEICHYVMTMVYGNKELPYFKEDEENEKVFMKITFSIKLLLPENFDDECDGIISSVFRCYLPKDYQVELAVRVAHILAQYSNNQSKITYLSEKYKELFQYVQNRIIPDLRKFLTFDHEKVRKINKTVGVMSKVEELTYNYVDLEDTTNLTNSHLTIIKTDQPKILLHKIYIDLKTKYVNLMDTKNIFINYDNFNNSKDFEDILLRNPNLNVFIDCSEGIDDTLKHIAANESINFIFIASSESRDENLTKIMTKLNYSPIKYEINIRWNNLDAMSQNKLLQTKINIRNQQVTLINLLSKSKEIPNCNNQQTNEREKKHDDYFEIFDNQMLSMLVNDTEISINTDYDNKKTEKDFKISFISRNFIKKFVEGSTKSESSVSHSKDRIVKKKEITEEMTEDQVYMDVNNKRYVLMSDMAGSGKSWAIQNFTEMFNEEKSPIWISKVELKEFIIEFKKDVETKIEFANYMIDKILKPKFKYEAAIFKKLYKIGKVYVFFDGFDEIAPDCTEIVTKLAQSFQFNDGNQLWIATRDYFEVHLQEKLGIDTVYKLQPFTEQDGINLITSNWIFSDLGEVVHKYTRSELKEVVKEHPNYKIYQERAQKLNHKISNMKNTSIGIPQFYKIVAIVIANSKDGSIIFTVPKIYGRFVEIQHKRWSSEKGEIRTTASSKLNSNYSINFNELHIFCAMSETYSEIKCFCGIRVNSDDWPEEEIIACGLLNKTGENISFIHETFGEYFAAQFIVRCLKKGDERDDEEFCKFFIDFLTVPKFGIVRVFLDEALNEEIIMKKLMRKIPKIADFFYKNVSKCDALSEIFEKNQLNLENIMRKMFEVGKYEDIKRTLFNSTKAVIESGKNMEEKSVPLIFSLLKINDAKDLFMQVDKNYYNFVHALVAKNRPEKVENTFEIFKKKFSRDQYREFLESRNPDKGNLLQTAACRSQYTEIHQFLWKILKDYCKSNKAFLDFILDVDKYNSNIIDTAAGYTTREIFEFMIEELKKMVSHEEVKVILSTLGFRNSNILESAASQNMSLDFHNFLWVVMEKYFNTSEISQMIKHTDKTIGLSLFSAAVRYNTTEIVEFLWNKMLTSETLINIMELIQQSDNYGRNILHLGVISGDKIKFRFLWNTVKDFLNNEGCLDQLKKLIVQQMSETKETFLHLTAKCDKIEFHDFIWELLTDYFENQEEFFKFVTKTDEDHQSFVHVLVMHSTPHIIMKIFHILKELFGFVRYQNIVESKGYIGGNLLHRAEYNSEDIETHRFLWKTLRDLYESDEAFLKFLFEVDNFGSNIFHIAAGYTTNEIFEFMIENLRKIASREEIKNIFDSLGYEKRNLLLFTAFDNKSLELHKSFWKIMINTFDPPEISQIIKHTDKYGRNLLHLVAWNNTKENLEFIWNKLLELEEIISKNEVLELLLQSSNDGWNIFHFCIDSKDKEKLEFIWNETQNFFKNEKQLKELLIQKTIDESETILHLASKSDSIDCYEYIWKKVMEYFNDKEELNNFILSTNRHDENFLHILITSNEEDLIEKKFKIFKENCTSAQYQNIIESNQYDCLNLLQSSIYLSKNIKTIQLLWIFLHDYFKSNEEFFEFLKEVDDHGCNILQTAACFSKSEILEFIIVELEKVTSPEEIKNFIISKRFDNDNLLHSAIRMNNSLELHQSLWKIIKKYLNKSEILEMIYHRNENENTILHNAVSFNTKEITEFTWEQIKSFIEKEEIQFEYLKMKGHEGNTIVQMSENNDPEVKEWVDNLNIWN